MHLRFNHTVLRVWHTLAGLYPGILWKGAWGRIGKKLFKKKIRQKRENFQKYIFSYLVLNNNESYLLVRICTGIIIQVWLPVHSYTFFQQRNIKEVLKICWTQNFIFWCSIRLGLCYDCKKIRVFSIGNGTCFLALWYLRKTWPARWWGNQNFSPHGQKSYCRTVQLAWLALYQ